MIKIRLKRAKLLKMLAKKNLSQNWLANRIGVSSGYISQVMTDKRNPSPKVRQKLLEYFQDCTFEELFRYKN